MIVTTATIVPNMTNVTKVRANQDPRSHAMITMLARMILVIPKLDIVSTPTIVPVPLPISP